MKNSGIILCCVALFGLGGCFKSVSNDTTCVIRSYIQTENNGPIESLQGVKAYAFAVDTTNWMVASYDDALAGIITSKRVLTEKISTPAAISGPYPASDALPMPEEWIQLQLSGGSSMMLVAVDPMHKLYAYRQLGLVENLSPLYITLQFRSWRASYNEGGWRVINPNYMPPTIDPDDVKPPKPDGLEEENPSEDETETPAP